MIDERQGPITAGLPILQRLVAVRLCHGPLDGLEMLIERGEDGRPPGERYFVSPYGDVKYTLVSSFAPDGAFLYGPAAT